MAPFVVAGQRVFVSRVAYHIGRPFQGDLVILRRDDGPLLIKRVVAGPRDRVRLFSGQVEVNGLVVHREDSRIADQRPPDFERALGPDEYFVLGEDPESSWDSRRFGPVRRREILGKVLGCYWPPPRWGLIGRSSRPHPRWGHGGGGHSLGRPAVGPPRHRGHRLGRGSA